MFGDDGIRTLLAGWLCGALGAACAAGGGTASPPAPEVAPAAASRPAPAPEVAATPVKARSVLAWSHAEKVDGFARMEALRAARPIRRGGAVRPMRRAAAPLAVSFEVEGETWTLDDYVARNRTAGLLVVHGGRIVYEGYGLGHAATGRWTSFSVAKSFTSTLVGAAIRDGAIASLEDPVTRYLPRLSGSGYDGVTVRQLLTMTSGVRWNEDYTDPASDVARFLDEPSQDGSDPTVTYMARLSRAAEPGTRWHYNTGETNLVGSLVEAATGRRLADYLSEKIWSRLGMEQDAVWLLNEGGREIAGCCVSATLRDYGRFGVFFLNGARIDDRSIVPEGWVRAATTSTKIAESAMGGRAGYGFLWWTTPGAAYRAAGIFGQGIHIDPVLDLVIVTQSAWDAALDQPAMRRRQRMIEAVTRAVKLRPPGP